MGRRADLFFFADARGAAEMVGESDFAGKERPANV